MISFLFVRLDTIFPNGKIKYLREVRFREDRELQKKNVEYELVTIKEPRRKYEKLNVRIERIGKYRTYRMHDCTTYRT